LSTDRKLARIKHLQHLFIRVGSKSGNKITNVKWSVPFKSFIIFSITRGEINHLWKMIKHLVEFFHNKSFRINPVKLIITNYPEGQVEELEAINNPEDPEAGSHLIEFSRELWMEREDFMEDAPKKYFRMTPGQEVRLKNAYIVKCTGCKKDENGVITEVYCEYDANTRSGMPDANRKVKGTLHWVSCNHCLQAEVRLYDRLWKVENPRDELAAIREAKKCEALEAMKEIINPDSLKVLPNCYIEKFAATLPPLSYLQFQRIGYFNIDKESTPDKLIFNRTVGLKDTWGKINK
jgi:glutaminyl-tRNA synthetase